MENDKNQELENAKACKDLISYLSGDIKKLKGIIGAINAITITVAPTALADSISEGLIHGVSLLSEEASTCCLSAKCLLMELERLLNQPKDERESKNNT